LLLIKLDVGRQRHEAGEALVFFIFYVLLRRAFFTVAHGKGRLLLCVLDYGTRRRPMIAVCFSAGACCLAPAPSVAFFAVRREKTHSKDSLPCVIRRDARQRGFTVQNATVCPLPCALTKNARQRICHAYFDLCRAHCFP
jgi:hypothetical protein